MILRITAFKGSPWQCGNTHEAVLEVQGRNANADATLGAHIVWRTRTGRAIRGKVVKRHGHAEGSKVVARFHKGLNGDALGQVVEVREAKASKVEKRTKAAPAKDVPAKHAAGAPAKTAVKPAAAPAKKKPSK